MDEETHAVSLCGSNDIDETEINESTSLSPLTYQLTLGEEIPLSPETKMGIESTWNEIHCPRSNKVIPLPAPPGMENFGDLGTRIEERNNEHISFMPSNSQTYNNLSSSGSPDSLGDIQTETPGGVCGLRNLGNTCFMAAGLQCLTATLPVLEHFLELQQCDKQPPSESLMARFSSLLCKMWSGAYSVVKPSEFKQTLGTYHSQFKDYRQHDCQEFLTLLLDTLHEQLILAKLPKFSSNVAAGMSNDYATAAYRLPPRSPDISVNHLGDPVLPSSNLTPPADDDDAESKVNGLNKFLVISMEAKQCGDFIAKDAKTNSDNFLVTQEECNNEIHYDSQKFPKENVKRIALGNANLTENHDFNNKSAKVKRIKEVNFQKNVVSDSECESEKTEKCNVKRMRLEEERGFIAEGIERRENGAIASQEEKEADAHWLKHLKDNRSVIVDTFQGQFKSKVICSNCEHVSVTYEPFMYLSVPLPHATERQISVTYVPANNEAPIRCVISLNKQSKVEKLKEGLLKILGKEDVPVGSIALTEVLDNHISKILDNNLMLKFVDTSNRSIYAFELLEAPEAFESEETPNLNCQDNTTFGEKTPNCVICLEDIEGDVPIHPGNHCNIAMCDGCIENYFKSSEDNRYKCPGCSAEVGPESFVKVEQSGQPRSVTRIIHVPLVTRHDTIEATNNKNSTELFGYPRLIKLPSRIDATTLHEVVSRIVGPSQESYSLHFVDGQGKRCSRCMYTAHCTGCEVPKEDIVTINTSDTLAVRYKENVPEILHAVDHSSVNMQKLHHPLSLYDCLQAFSQSETLDELNPWYCPKCQMNRCATKTLTVHRYPKCLIVYLKRFVFYECSSMKLDDKVTFPLVGLSLDRYLYDLYACVCHFGGVSAGHYTAYTKNPRSNFWHYFNDETTSKQKPQDEDFSNAYILFYNRQGTNVKSCNL